MDLYLTYSLLLTCCTKEQNFKSKKSRPIHIPVKGYYKIPKQIKTTNSIPTCQ